MVTDSDDMEVAVALLELVQEILHGMNGMQKLVPFCDLILSSWKLPSEGIC